MPNVGRSKHKPRVTLSDEAKQALKRLTVQTGIRPSKPLEIAVYEKALRENAAQHDQEGWQETDTRQAKGLPSDEELQQQLGSMRRFTSQRSAPRGYLNQLWPHLESSPCRVPLACLRQFFRAPA